MPLLAQRFVLYCCFGATRGAARLFQSVLDGVVGNHFFLEYVGSGLGRFDHFDYLAVGAAFALLERCDGFLCHISELLFDFFVNGNSFKNRVVLLELKTLGGVFAVFGGDVTRGAGHTAGLMFGAFEDNLYSIAFSFLCHFSNSLLNYAFK